MRLSANTYGKARVRVMRVYREGAYNEVRELSVQAMLEGDFAAAYTDGDNSTVVATDTIKNIVNIVARENLRAAAEVFAERLATRLLDRYSHVMRATVTCRETRWPRADAHPHHFVLDGNGLGTATVAATRDGAVVTSGIDGFTFMKSTEAGWVGYVQDEYTTLPETTDRIVATAMTATWTWNAAPADYEQRNALILRTMLAEFAGTYSRGVQDSLFRMAGRALEAVPELETVSMACPNKHYLPIDLSRFGLQSDNCVFTATDEPHGQIECTVARG
ncbi:MAG: urate oxidase [Alphaproteobacteria bacterium]|nr:MAG: urate oxidase [Alphaproteobacteria bacterium]